ncbi:hypothetical protein KFE25_000315 [Diacronema lutheri]|uniref:Uncharacterized protein n=1 Tax=Diacronema lutheri TaxID=2081491 RepID=A0A8J5XUZ5_DIALT|nr:hypothetical protein KFE25_000315 [Diacronema lutheri]
MKVVHLRTPPRTSAHGERAATPTSASHARSGAFTRTFVAPPSSVRGMPDSTRLARAVQDGAAPSPRPLPASPGFLALLGGGSSEADGGLPTYDRRARSPRFAAAADEDARARASPGCPAGARTSSPAARAFGARPGMRPGTREQTRSTWIEACGDDTHGPVRPPPPVVASSMRPAELGLQRPPFVRTALAEGYAGYAGEHVGGTVSELLHGAADAPPPPPMLAGAAATTPRARGSASAWAERMHGGGGGGGGGERPFAYVRTDVPDDPTERARRRDAVAHRAHEMYSPARRDAASPPRGARDRAIARAPGDDALALRGLGGGAARQLGGAANGPLALAAALARARVPDMRAGVAVPSSRLVLAGPADPSWAAARPADSFADLGVGIAASAAESYDDGLPRRARSPGRVAASITNLGFIEPRAGAHSPSRRAGGESAQRQRNGSAAAARALLDAADPARWTGGAADDADDPAQTPPLARPPAREMRRGRAATPPRDERASVAYALGIDGHALRGALAASISPQPSRARSPARASKASDEPDGMFALLGQWEYPNILRASSPRAGSEGWRSPRAGRELGGVPVRARSPRAWR